MDLFPISLPNISELLWLCTPLSKGGEEAHVSGSFGKVLCWVQWTIREQENVSLAVEQELNVNNVSFLLS